jgi:hypothetical protein
VLLGVQLHKNSMSKANKRLSFFMIYLPNANDDAAVAARGSF